MFKKILVPVDFSRQSLKAVEVAVNVAKNFGSEVIVLHAVQSLTGIAPIGPSAMSTVTDEKKKTLEEERLEYEKKQGLIAKNMLENVASSFRKENIDVDSEIVTGNPAETIIRFAEAMGADLIIMGSKGESEIKRFSMGSVCDKVIHNVRCNVLVIR